MTHSSKLRNSVSMPSINLLPLRSILDIPFHLPILSKKMKTHVEISVLSSLRIQQVKKKKRKRSSLQKLTHFFVRHSSFTFVLSREKRNMTLKLLPHGSFRYIHVRLSLESRKQIPKAWHGAKRERCEFSGRGRAC